MYKSIQQHKFPVNGISITKGITTDDPSPLHQHDFNEIVIIISGTAVQHINNCKYSVAAGDVFIIKDSDKHQFSNVHNLKLFNIGYKDDVLVPFDSILKKLPGYFALFFFEPYYRQQHEFKSKLHLNTKGLIELSHMIDLIDNEFTNRDIGNELMITSHFLQVIGFLCRKYDAFSKKIKRSFIPSLSNTISYIESNYYENLKLNTLADMAGVSINGLINIFKNHFGVTPLSYIISLRIQKACEIMHSSDKPITEIAFEVGFTDSNYFSRAFKKNTGITPSEYKKTMSTSH